jgi:hypothetical protein
MSLASAFDQQVQSYADQLENYNEQVDSYKNSLIEMRDQVKESTDALVEGVVSPIAAELLRTGVGQVFGAEAGEAAAALAKGGISTLAKGGSVKDVFNSFKESISGDSEDSSALDSAKEGLASVMQKIRGGDVEGAADAVSSAQGQLESAVGSLASNVTSKLDTGVVSTLRNQIARITGAQTQQNTSPLAQADKAMETDTKVFGDVELSDFANGPAKLMSPDLSLPFEATFEAPIASPGATSNMIAEAITGRLRQAIPEVPDSVIPSQEDALAMIASRVRPMITSDNLPTGAGQVLEGAGEPVDALTALTSQAEGLATSVAGQAQGLVSGLATDAEGVASSLAGQATSAVSGLASRLSGLAEGVAPEITSEVEAGAAAGPEGLIFAGVVALGTLLAGVFGHKTNEHLVAPPQLPQLSVPQFAPGLATGD